MTLKPQIRVCKICFQEIKPSTPFTLIHKNPLLCDKCYQSLDLQMKAFTFCGVKITSLYVYDDTMQSLIYQFKGCFDYELKDVFLERYKKELYLMFNDFIIIPTPSSEEDDIKRGFNHVIEIYKVIGLPMNKIIIKTGKFKQAEHNKKDRNQISNYLKLTPNPNIKNKKILLVDDIFTTGSTIKACLSLIKPLKPKEIQVLVMCKTPMKPLNT